MTMALVPLSRLPAILGQLAPGHAGEEQAVAVLALPRLAVLVPRRRGDPEPRDRLARGRPPEAGGHDLGRLRP